MLAYISYFMLAYISYFVYPCIIAKKLFLINKKAPVKGVLL